MNNRLRIPFIAALLLLTLHAGAQRQFVAVQYNLENVFDTIHEAGKSDEDFLPQSKRAWTSQRYWRKLGIIARTIAAIGRVSPPDLITVCEVENDSVVRDLAERTMLRRLGYKYICTASDDERGIDVALLYQPLSFCPLKTDTLRIPFHPARGERPTRDVLCVDGLLTTGDTLCVMVCHWPSRRGGAAVNESYRMRAAQTVRARCDSIMRHRARPFVLICGDMNDEFSNLSVRAGLSASPVPANNAPIDERALYVLTARLRGRKGIEGTYKFRGEWNQLDQIVVSGALLSPASPFRVAKEGCRIVDDVGFLLEEDKGDRTVRPRPTYRGTFYVGGVSDHLPVRTVFVY